MVVSRFLAGLRLTRLQMGRVKRIWYLPPMRAAKVQASLRIRAVSPEPPLLAHTSSESRGTFRQKARSLAPLNGWACAVKICHDGMSKTQIRLTRSKCFPLACRRTLIRHTGMHDTYSNLLMLEMKFMRQVCCKCKELWLKWHLPDLK